MTEPEDTYDPTSKTIDEIMADVENGVVDAQSVLVVEQGESKPRTTLVERLTRYIEENPDDGDGSDLDDVDTPEPEQVSIAEGAEVLTTPDPVAQEGYTSSDVGQEQGTPAPEPKGSTGEALEHRNETRTY